MSKLIVKMNPVSSTEIFVVKSENKMEKVSQVQMPLDMMKFLANYIKDNKESTEVIFIGPDDYIDPWITEVNQFEFTKAHKLDKGE